ncbi:MAG: hypothetical protein LBB05_04360 [Puniceicoccales bacterium]|jgi:hypothetical protein|nr:hypothetical protein [Puniceicoccales bacterium]
MDIKKMIMLGLLGVTGTFGIQWWHASGETLSNCYNFYQELERAFSGFQVRKDYFQGECEQAVASAQIRLLSEFRNQLCGIWDEVRSSGDMSLICATLKGARSALQQQGTRASESVYQNTAEVPGAIAELRMECMCLHDRYLTLINEIKNIAKDSTICYPTNVNEINQWLGMFQDCITRICQLNEILQG